MTGTILTLANGRGIDLLAPKASDIDFAVIAEHLAKENRYNGATPNRVYSVAEHSSRGAEAIFDATGDRLLSAYFQIHDAPEAFLKDDTTPKKRALTATAMSFGVLADTITQSFDLLTERFDAAIHEAAGLPWPPTPDMQAQIKHWDLTMFVTEWRDLMGDHIHPHWGPYEHIVPLPERIIPWCGWTSAYAQFVRGCHELLPALRRRE